MIYVKPATSLVVVFRAYLSSDHVTPATGKTIVITISKNGGAFGNPNAGATNATEMTSGFYKVTLDTTDTGTSGPLAVRGAVATVDDVGVLYYVGQVPADVTHILGTAASTPATAGILDVNVKNMNNVAATSITTIKAVQGLAVDGVITTLTNLPAITANWLTAAGTATDFGTEIATAIWTDATAGDFTAALSVGKSVMNGVTLGTGLTIASVSGAVGSVTGAVGSVTGAVGSVTGAVGSVTGAVGSVGAGGIVSGTFAAGAITAAAIATDAIDADALAADAVTEIWAKAMTELTSVPGVSGTVLQALSWVFEVSRNKITQTSTTQLVKKDDGTTTLGTSTVSDDGTTFTRGVFS